jgi:hypothetical protein
MKRVKRGGSAEMSETADPLDPLNVHDVETFLAFVSALASDRRASVAAERLAPSSPYGPAAGGWENTTIEDFLESARAWADCGLPEEPSWQAFAIFLHCGKIYE